MFHPKMATSFMLVWVIGKALYTVQYASGKPAARVNETCCEGALRADHAD